MASQMALLSLSSCPSMDTLVGSNCVFCWGHGSWYRRHGLPVVGCGTTSGRPLSSVLSNDGVDTVQVFSARVSAVSVGGKRLKTCVDDEKMVKPVSFGDAVDATKNWKLPRISCDSGQKTYNICLPGRARDGDFLALLVDVLGRLEQSVVVKRHPLGRQDIVQSLRVFPQVLDLEHKAKLPAQRLPKLP